MNENSVPSELANLPVQNAAILTLEGNFNFGNVLQNFALQETLLQLGVGRVDTIRGIPVAEPAHMKYRRWLRKFALNPRHGLQQGAKKLRGSGKTHLHPVPDTRQGAISRFSAENIRFSPLGYTELLSDDAPLTYDRAIVGSDQVWNPAFIGGNSAWFLDFAKPHERIAYAASIGVPKIPGYLNRTYREGIADIAYVSVREHEAAEIVRRLTGVTPPVVLDPTMVLGPTFWEELATIPAALEGKEFVLSFRLKQGNSGRSNTSIDPFRRSHVTNLAHQNGYQMVDLFAPSTADLIELSPLQFIGAIGAARLVITDSFHAAAFSTLFHTPFLLEQRGNMNSRFETLLHHTGLKDRMLDEVTDVEAALDVDWDGVDKRLEVRRQESLDFLTSALGLAPLGQHG